MPVQFRGRRGGSPGAVGIEEAELQQIMSIRSQVPAMSIQTFHLSAYPPVAAMVQTPAALKTQRGSIRRSCNEGAEAPGVLHA